MCPPSFHHNGFVSTHALGNMMYGCICYMMHGICIYIYKLFCLIDKKTPRNYSPCRYNLLL